MKRETPSQAGLKYVGYNRERRLHIFEDESGKREGWVANKGHASYGLKFRGTCLEFVTSDV
jgi:hypothetical protein